MRRRTIASILIGLALILSTVISTVSMVQKIAYAQFRNQPSSNGVHVANSMTQASTVVGRNSAVQGVAGALSSVHTTSVQSINKFDLILIAIHHDTSFGRGLRCVLIPQAFPLC